MKRYENKCGCRVNEAYDGRKHIPYRTRCKLHKLKLDLISDYNDWKTGFDKTMYWTRKWIKHQLLK
jgi:hypothetical protein|tara:strand:- start:494 stop:691 length:198 start_codon:yes stop_codon:yes gene_type:complete